MKRFDKAAVFLVPATILVLLGIFARPLGLSEMTGLLIFLTALVFLFIGYREVLKTKEARQFPVPSEHQKPHRFWLLACANGLACAAMPFLLPLTGVNLPFSQRVIISVIAFFICIGTTWFSIRKGLGMTKNH